MNTRRKALTRRQGLTLIELLVASLILVVAMMGLMILFAFSFNSTLRSDEQCVGFSLGRMAVERVRALGWMYRADAPGTTYYKSNNSSTGLVQLANSTGAQYRVDVYGDDQSATAEHHAFSRIGVQVTRIADSSIMYTTRIGLTIGGN